MTSRTVILRSLVQAISLVGFSVLVSGCFQTAGAQVQATMTPIGGAAIVSVTPIPSDQALTTVNAPPTAITLIAAQPTDTPSVPQLVFASPTSTLGAPTDTAIPTNTALPSATVPTSLPTLTFTPVTFTPTFTATVPSMTPSFTPTEPAIITPTQNTVLTIVAQQGTAAFNSISATQTQAAVFDQATSIVATATAGMAAQETLVATLQGTGGPAQPTQPTDNGGATSNPAVDVTLTPTLLPSINNGAVPGAMGSIDNNCRYTVVDGDRLFRIALRFNMSTYQVAYPNRLINPDLIVPGEVIVIPGCTGTPAPTTTGSTTAHASGTVTGSTYTVVDNDTLYSIATRFGVRVMALAQVNGISNINLIYIGQTLTIPGS